MNVRGNYLVLIDSDEDCEDGEVNSASFVDLEAAREFSRPKTSEEADCHIYKVLEDHRLQYKETWTADFNVRKVVLK